MNRRRPTTWHLRAALLATAAGATAVGCSAARRPVPFDPPAARPLAPADAPDTSTSLTPSLAAATADPGMRRPREILALSSGGVYGAFSAGLIAGWTQAGTRPEFDVVTGVSTGALIAPFAFLGPEYDCLASRLYAGVKTDDIYRLRAWVTIPWKDAVATSAPLRRLIRSQTTPEIVAKIAAEHRKGRRLYVGTTNLDTRRFVVWDVGAIAARGTPEAVTLVQDVLLASASVPGVFPPVLIDIEVDGKRYQEVHCDGGASAPVFVPTGVFAAAAAGAEADGRLAKVAPGNLYVVIAGKAYPDAEPIRRRILPVLGATADSLLYSLTRSELANLYALSAGSGLRFQMAALRQDFRTVDVSLDFNVQEQGRLLAEGAAVGAAGPRWDATPPEAMAGDGDYVRTGVKLKAK